MGEVTAIDHRERKDVEQMLESLTEGAESLVMIVALPDGTSRFMIQDEIQNIPALICAVRRCMYELEMQYECQHED